jgi:hypothetical protein
VLVVRVKHWTSSKWMRSETLASSALALFNQVLALNRPTLECKPQPHTARMSVLAYWVVHWLARNWLVLPVLLAALVQLLVHWHL